MLKNPDFITFLTRLICVPECSGCGERLLPFSKTDNLSYGRVCLCESCMHKWQTAKREMCHTCYMPAGQCKCTNWNRKIKQPYVPSLFFYHKDRSKVQNRVLFAAKCKSRPELFEFLAKELAPQVKRLIFESGADINDCIFTWIPRKPKSVKKYGHDQAKMLALALAEELDCNYVLPMLIRRGGKEQKKLDEKARSKNTLESVFLREHLTLKEKRMIKKLCPDKDKPSMRSLTEGKTVIVIDDIITTGASMRRAILLIEPQKPKRILSVCVARSEIRSKK